MLQIPQSDVSVRNLNEYNDNNNNNRNENKLHHFN